MLDFMIADFMYGVSEFTEEVNTYIIHSFDTCKKIFDLSHAKFLSLPGLKNLAHGNGLANMYDCANRSEIGYLRETLGDSFLGKYDYTVEMVNIIQNTYFPGGLF